MASMLFNWANISMCCKPEDDVQDACGDTSVSRCPELPDAPEKPLMAEASEQTPVSLVATTIGGDGNGDGTGSELSSDDAALVFVKTLSRQKSMTTRIDTLMAVDIFSRFPEDELLLLAEAFTNDFYEQGQMVIQEGDPGSELFIVQAGTAIVSVAADPTLSVELETGHWFGEKALLYDMPRMATVTALTHLAVIKLSRDKFQQLGLNEKVFSVSRKAIVGSGDVIEDPKPSAVTEKDVEFCVRALNGNKNLQSCLSHLTDGQLRTLAQSAKFEKVSNGTVLIQQGSFSSTDDCFYIVKSGRFVVFKHDPHEVSTSRKSTCAFAEMGVGNLDIKKSNVSTMTAGMCFGELALLYAAPRSANVQAVQDSEVFAIGRHVLKSIVEVKEQHQAAIWANALRNVAMFDKLTDSELKDLAAVMQESRLEKGDVIVQQGADGDTFYVLVDGKVGVFKDDKQTGELSASLAESISVCFGERALLQKEPRAATIRVMSDSAYLLSCDRDGFKYLLAGLFEVLQNGARPAKVATKKVDIKDMVAKRMPIFGKIKRKDLKKVGVLGFGGLGVIELREHQQTKKQYALKMMSKGYIVKLGLQQKIQHTRDILVVMNSPFIIDLVEAYNASQALYFLMESCLGGDLLNVYNRKGFHGSLVHCKFYVASLIMAFEHMHRHRIVYRDTKPENVLIDNLGTLKLVDMDCAKFSPGKTFTVCGTPEYFSPEMISMQGHTMLVDWWGLGVLTFELLAGFTPFVAETPMMIYKRVAAGISEVKFPLAVKPPAQEFIKKLLLENPRDRLPAKPNGNQLMKNLVFWRGTDFAGIRNQTVKPPYVPRVSARVNEARKFQPTTDEMPPQIVHEDDGTGWDADFATST